VELMLQFDGELPSTETRGTLNGTVASYSPIIQQVAGLVDDLAKALGPGFEVIVHDLSRPESSIVAIAGGITGRKVGAPVTDLVLRLLRAGRTDQSVLNYETKTANGKLLRSSTIFIRDESGNAVGCLCVNHDITNWIVTRSVVSRMCETQDPLDFEAKPDETFATNVSELFDAALEKSVSATGKPASLLDRNDRIAVVGKLDEQGIFQIRGAVPHIACALGVSRFTVYNYLDEIRASSDGEAQKP
jgi:predicted transcriptional regulator YheO